ncbi:sigma-54-dependent Fis family transcriptional regulator [Aquimarina mytili]|uniref:Sigma 54-interacting transcriptional regulator n=1 Tax=Aquimarina mytili TaxID=874423 RepID=A0A936ZU54_9FLAO|nr:sigma 54-interacting transcriptional regulator [Aquimarina mytili]MBL0684753.1 sigma 54-interacting transcriptional regulator [Aquimarina mytili]
MEPTSKKNASQGLPSDVNVVFILEALIKVENSQDLLKVILEKVNTVFPFDDVGLFEINEKGEHRDFAVDEYNYNQISESIKNAGIKGFLAPDEALNSLLDKTNVTNLETLFNKFDKHPHFPFLLEAGLRHFISTPLYSRGKLFGLFILWSKKEKCFTTEHFPLFEKIANVISVPFKNIIDRENLIQERNFKDSLLQITEALASVNSEKELYRTLFNTVKPILPFDEFGLFVLDESKDYHYELIDENTAQGLRAQQLIETNLGKHTKYQHKGSTAEWLMSRTESIHTIEFLIKKTHHPQLKYMQEAGLQQMISAPLTKGGETFGLLCLNSRQKDFYKKFHLPFFKNIAEQFSVTVSNILANNQIQNEKTFKETLLNISTAVSHITNRNDLFKFIFGQIKSILNFDNAGLFYLNIEQDCFYELLEEDIIDPIQDNLSKNNLLGPFDYSSANENAWIYTDDIALFDIAEQSKIYPNPQWDIMLEGGLKKMIAGPLNYGGQKIGLICFNSKDTNQYSNENFKLFRAISEQVAIALNNVIANEKIEQRNLEKTQLLSITQKVNEITDIKDFLRFTNNHLKPIFNFVDIGTFLLTEDKEYHYDVVTLDSSISPSNWNIALSEEKSLFRHRASLIDWMMQQNTKNNNLTLFDFVDLQKKYPDYYQFKLKEFKEAGYRDCLAANLRVGESEFGMFCINAVEKNYFDKGKFTLFKNIVEQLSIAISNILANDRLAREKDFSETLLDLTEAISSAITPLELYNTITKPVKKVIPFEHLGILILDDNKTQHYELLSERFDIKTPLTINDLGNAMRYEHENTSVKWLMDNGPVIVSMDYLAKHTSHPRNKDMVAAGLKTLLGGPLIANGELFGMMAFKSKTEDVFTDEHVAFFRAISKQVAVTVSNILAQHHLVREKKFSETLLHITESLSSVRSTTGLYKKIFKSVQPVFPFQEMAIMLLDKSGNYNFELTDDTKSIHRHVPNMAEELWGQPLVFKHSGSITEWFKNNGPVAISIEEAERQVHEPLHEHLLAAGFHHIIGGPLVSNSKPFGILVFFSKTKNFYRDEHIPMYKAINEQVSLAVSNILASEEVSKQNALQALEINLSQNIPHIKDYHSFFGSFLQHLKEFMPFTYAMISLQDNENSTGHYQWITPKEYRSLGMKEMKVLYSLSENEVKEQENQLLRFKLGKKGFINDLDKQNALPFKKLIQNMGLKSMLKKEFPMGGGTSKLSIILFNKQPYKFLPSDYEALSSLENTIVLSFDNMLASREIEKLSEQLLLEKSYLETAVREAYNFGDMVGDSEAMQAVFQQIKEVSQVDATTLILGETGTGKELIARAIHENSTRKDRVLVKVNCAAIPAQIVESELFGHEKGAFTGAIQQRIGKFELANHGTIFLDEIGEMPLDLQTKLLRVLQEREVERLGSNKIIKLDIRIIAATNRNLAEEVEKGKFREDLFYRLNSYPIIVPPLRSRGDDILLLADFFARQFSERYALPYKGFTKNTTTRLLSYEWPGNVRELQNLLEQAIISQKGKVLEIYPGRSGVPGFEKPSISNKAINLDLISDPEFDMESIKEERDKLERNYLLKVLELTKWRVSGKYGAARKLGVAPSTLESRMRKLGITRQ